MTPTLSQLAEKVGSELLKRRLVLATAESCTGGGLSYWITSIPGSSTWFDRGFITYSNAAKIAMLGLSPLTLESSGAVSSATAQEMAVGALRHSNATISIAITGIAGPEGGSDTKPVGTVWIACAQTNKPTQTQLSTFPGDRQLIREQAIETALAYLLKNL
jgi:nicotinamide-nucleotide amidase